MMVDRCWLMRDERCMMDDEKCKEDHVFDGGNTNVDDDADDHQDKDDDHQDRDDYVDDVILPPKFYCRHICSVISQHVVSRSTALYGDSTCYKRRLVVRQLLAHIEV